MVAQEWEGTKLKSSVYFEPDEQGLDLFSAYLSSLKKEPVRLLVDLIEEEFRQEKIPMLRGGDRKDIINRFYTKYFRNSQFRVARQIEVIKKERKEERLLIAGLTNPDLLKPWLEIIHSTKTPLIGIQSLPIVSEALIDSLSAEHNCIILVSQQVPSNLRQSVFINGKLILSRLVPIASFYQGDYATDVTRDIESTQRYLVSQRIVDRSDTIGVHILSNDRHFDKLTVKCTEDNFFDYKIHKINEIIDQQKIELDEDQDFSSAIFCYLATKKALSNHYASNQEKKYLYHHLSSLGLKIASIVLVALGLGLMMTSMAKGLIYEESVKEMTLLEQKYNSKFNQLNEQMLDSSVSTINMKNLVLTIERIQETYLRSPHNMMSLVSQDIALFPDMRVTGLNWFVASSPTASQADGQAQKAASNNRRSRNRRAVKNKLYEILVVNGELRDFNGDYRYALSVIDDIEDTMKVSKKYDEVIITKRPLNIDSTERLSGDVSNKVNKSKSGKRAQFSFKVAKEIKLNEK